MFVIIPGQWQAGENEILAELSTCRVKQHMCRDGIPPKNCAAVIILALGSSNHSKVCFKKKLYTSIRSTIHSGGWIITPGFPSIKKWNSTCWFCSPPPPPPLFCRGRDVFLRQSFCKTLWMLYYVVTSMSGIFQNALRATVYHPCVVTSQDVRDATLQRPC